MLGYDHESFWDQTSHTLSLTFEAANDRFRREHNDRAWLAYHIAGLGRAKKFPQLRSLMIKDAVPRSLQQQLDDLRDFVEATGGKVIYKPREKLDG